MNADTQPQPQPQPQTITADVLTAVATQLHERISTIDAQITTLQSERSRIQRALATLADDGDLAANWQPAAPAAAAPAADTTSTTRDTLTEVKPRTLREAVDLVMADGQPRSGAAVADAVLARGWRTHSDNFKQVVYMVLKAHFARTGTGRDTRWTVKTTSNGSSKRSKRGAR